jgi:hypothetical protein
MPKLNEEIAVALLPPGMRQALVEFRDLYFKACRIGISQLSERGQIAIKHLLKTLTDEPRPPEDAQLSASDTEDGLPELIAPSDSDSDHPTLALQSRARRGNQGSSCMDSRRRRGTGAMFALAYPLRRGV